MLRPLLHRRLGRAAAASPAPQHAHGAVDTRILRGMHPTPSSPIPTDADLLATVRSLIGPAARDQCWLLLQDADGVPLPLVVPIEDVPMHVDAVPVVARAVAGIAQAAHAASVTLVWERLGPDLLDDEEAAFVADVREAVAVHLPVRAQLLSSDRGVRLLPLGTAA